MGFNESMQRLEEVLRTVPSLHLDDKVTAQVYYLICRAAIATNLATLETTNMSPVEGFQKAADLIDLIKRYGDSAEKLDPSKSYKNIFD